MPSQACDMTPDIRRVRAQRMLALTLDVLNKHARSHPMGLIEPRYVANDLLYAYMAAGVEVLSDYDRELYGLPPRGEKGWTVEELQAMDDRRVAAFRQPLPTYVIHDRQGVMTVEPAEIKKPDNQG